MLYNHIVGVGSPEPILSVRLATGAAGSGALLSVLLCVLHSTLASFALHWSFYDFVFVSLSLFFLLTKVSILKSPDHIFSKDL